MKFIKDKVEIDLNDADIALILDLYNNKITNFKQVKSYEIACKVFGHTPNSKASTHDKLRMIARAINSLIDNNTAFPDWNNTKQDKHFPYLRKENGKWVFVSSGYGLFSSRAEVGYFKTKEASDFFGTEHLDLLVQYIEEF